MYVINSTPERDISSIPRFKLPALAKALQSKTPDLPNLSDMSDRRSLRKIRSNLPARKYGRQPTLGFVNKSFS
jgi:hypothetical protein